MRYRSLRREGLIELSGELVGLGVGEFDLSSEFDAEAADTDLLELGALESGGVLQDGR